MPASGRAFRCRTSNPQDLRWIRQPFLDDETDHGCVVVHGHTITEAVDERANRIGLDTGAYRTGVLTALGWKRTNAGFCRPVRQSIQTTWGIALPSISTLNKVRGFRGGPA